MTAILVLALATVAMAADDPFVGTWKKNVERSQAGSSPQTKSETITITAQDNGYKILTDRVGVDGKRIHVEDIVPELDGKERPVAGNAYHDAEINRRAGTNTLVNKRKKNGKEVASANFVVSEDGKTLTITIKQNATQGNIGGIMVIYDRQ